MSRLELGGEPVTLHCADGIASVRLNRPHRLNAFNVSMHLRLAEVLDEVSADEGIKILVLTGAGRAFSAGQDLQERADSFQSGVEVDLRRSLDDLYNPLIRSIATMSVPVIAMVHGVAFGAGAALALSCDLVLAGASSRFQFGFRSVALGPDCGSSWLLPRLCGLPRALDLLLTGRSLGADEALQMGLISRVVPDDRLLEETRAIAGMLSEAPTETLRSIKRLVRAGMSSTLDEALDAERDSQAKLGSHPAYREAVLSFVNRAATRGRDRE